MTAPPDLSRYRRHLTLPEVGAAGQERLRASSVLCVGAGGLGSPVILYLAAAGIGRLGLVDDDQVDITNLQRQVLYGTDDIGLPKTDRAASAVRRLNPEVEVDIHPVRLDDNNARDLLQPYDLVIDGSDNFPTRYRVNDACVQLGKPNVYASVQRFEGRASVFGLPNGPCYRCLYPDPPPPGSVPSCAEAGVLGVLPGLMGMIQATEAIKVLLDLGRPLTGRLLIYDALAMTFRELALPRDPACPCCGDHPAPRAPTAVQPAPCTPLSRAGGLITVEELQAKLTDPSPPQLVDVREPWEFALCRLPDAHLIPLNQLAARIDELELDRELVIYCHLGGRSAAAARLVREAGRRRVRDLAGGIAAWADQIDPSMPRY